MVVIVRYMVATLLPAVASAVFYLLINKTRLRDASYLFWQTTIGIVFGLIAVYGTEFGISTGDATINVRDAAPITAGLLFGGPAGVIAGLIGGVERWFAALWGRGMFTRIACSVATVLAGVYAALLHHHMFDERKPSISMGAAIGVVIEVLHLTLIFLTNFSEPHRAFTVVQTCYLPMIALNGLSVGIAILVIKLMSHEPLRVDAEHRRISQSVLSWMLVVIVVAFGATTFVTRMLQNSLAMSETKTLLSLNIRDMRDDVMWWCDDALLGKARRLAQEIPSCAQAEGVDLAALADEYEVTDAVVVNADGIVVASSDERYLGFDMASSDQASAFLALLPGGRATEFVQRLMPTSYDEGVQRKYAGVSIEDGFVQVGFDEQQYHEEVEYQMLDATKNRHVGETGFILIVDEAGEIVSKASGSSVRRLSYTGIDHDIETAGPDELISVKYLSTPCYAVYEVVEGYTIIALQPAYEADFSRDVAVVVGSFMVIIVFAALFTVIYFVIKHVVVNNIWRVNARLAQITSGNLNAEVDVRTNAEFASLSDDINETVLALKGYIEEAAARIDQELEYAREIQLESLPSAYPFQSDSDGFDIFASMDAAKQVGGDFYDFYYLDENHLAFVVADVSGKGIPAALFMMRAKSVLKSSAEQGIPVDEVFITANKHLCEGNDANMFVTAWMGVIDLRDGTVSYANAGHNPPAVWHGGEGWSLLSMRKNLMLGCMEGIPYRSGEIKLEPGDVIYLYTDGVVEAMDVHEVQYGADRMLSALERGGTQDVEALCMCVRADVNAFAGEAKQYDDITMLALRWDGGRSAASGESEQA